MDEISPETELLSPKLQALIDKLSNPDAAERVRLVRRTKALYETEHPDAARGKAQAAGARRAKAEKRGDLTPESGVTPFADWLADQLHLGVTTVRTLIARADYVPEAALKAIKVRKDIRRVGGLLDSLAYVLRKDPSADWRLVIENHVRPPKMSEARKLYLIGNSALMSRDARFLLDAKPRRLFDAIITDPPFGMEHTGKVNGAMTDDKQGALWAVPLMAQHVKPEGVICIWCSGGTLGRWTKAVLDSGLVISALVHWSKGKFLDNRGEEVMLVAGHRQVHVPDSLRIISVPTLPAMAPERAVHDTPKPVQLFLPIIETLTEPDDYIFDAFAGTGVVGEAAIRTGRNYVGAELDHKLAQFAATRLRYVHQYMRVADMP